MLRTPNARPAAGGDDPTVDALVMNAICLGREPWELEASIEMVLDGSGGDVGLLNTAKDQLVKSLIAGAAPHDAKTGVFILRCAALRASMK